MNLSLQSTFRHPSKSSILLLRGAIVLVELWTPHIFYVRFRDKFLQGGVVSPTSKPPTWRTRVSLLVWHLPQNLFGMGDAISSYATTDIAFDFMDAHKLPHPATKRFRQGGDTIQGAKSSLTCSKVLHGADGFTAPSKEDELRIFIDLEIHRHWPGLNLRTLGPTASTLTVTSQRTTCGYLHTML
jgi:hypothetical protein